MKQLMTSSGRYGPFKEVATLADRFRCDGADYLIAVVGDGAVSDWEGDLPAPYVPPPTAAEFETALTNHLDATAQARKYDNRITCAVRAGYTGPFQAEGQAFALWMDTCNALAYQLLAEVQVGSRPMPTTTQALIDELPPMVWPA